MADDADDNRESELESLVDDALEGAETDEEDRVVRVDINGVEHEFKDVDDLRHALVEEVRNEILNDLNVDEDFDADWFVDNRMWASPIESRFESLYPRPDPNQLLLRFDELLPASAEEGTILLPSMRN